MNEDRIVQRITQVFEEKFDKKFDALSAKIDGVESSLSARMDKFDITQDLLVQKVVDMDTRLDTFVTREEFERRMDHVSDVLDTHTVILQRLDAERSVTNFRLDRLESHTGLV